MGGDGFAREWARHADQVWKRSGGPPPWVSGLFAGFGGPASTAPRPSRARKGDVRAAILDMLATESMNGYQLITTIAERTSGAWKPSPGSVYPTLQQLEDEGLVVADADAGRRTYALTEEGRDYVAGNPEELAAVWEPFAAPRETGGDFANLKPEIGQVLNAAWQIITTGSDRQRREAVEVLVDTRRRLYGILAEPDATGTTDEPEGSS